MIRQKSVSAVNSMAILALVLLFAAGAALVAGAPNSLEQVSAGNDFYELHVWASNASPRSAFADINPSAPCELTSAYDEM